MRRLPVLVTASVMSLGLIVIAGPAQAAFPGPDGRIVFVTIKGEAYNIATMGADGSQVTLLTHIGSGSWASEPSWSPDATSIAFDRQRFPGTFHSQIWVMNADGTDQHRLLPDPFFIDLWPSYSPDGSSIVFSRCRSNSECAIYRMSADGTDLTAITSFKTSVSDFVPKYSPDGATIAFESHNRGGVDAAVYLMNADGSNVHRLTPARLGGVAPDWSPDGSRIVFGSQCCTNTAIWAINIDKTRLRQLTSPGERHDFFPAYAPAGDKILFERDAADFSKSSVHVMNPDGSDQTKLRRNPSGEPQWGIAP